MERVRLFCLGRLTCLIAGDASYFIFLHAPILLTIQYFTINEMLFQYLLHPVESP